MTRRKITQDQLLELILKEIEEKGWTHLNLCHVAESVGLNLQEVYQFFPKKETILSAFFTKIDQELLRQTQVSSQEGATQDRLFALIMDRFDLLQSHKPVLNRLRQDLWQDLPSLFNQAQLTCNSMRWILEASGLETGSLCGMIRSKIFTGFYLSVVYTWLNDVTEDMAVTMSALDQGLKRLERIPGFYE